MKTSFFIRAFGLVSILGLIIVNAKGQEANDLVKKVRDKLATVADYEGEGVMKTDVSFMKVPDANVTVYYKKPDKFKIKKQNGISIVPKGGTNINLSSLFTDNNYTIVGAGKGTVNGIPVSIVKLLPTDDKSQIVLSTLYVDEKDFLIRKATVTTRETGTYEMEMIYGSYTSWGLPDKVTFTFAIKDYKLPKGLAFDYDSGEKPKKEKVDINQKGKVEITYTKYTINKGLPDSYFQ